MTIRQRVLSTLLHSATPMTATQLHRTLNVPDGVSDFIGVELSSLSSVLKRMYDAGELRRVDDYGPRGGYGYQVNHT